METLRIIDSAGNEADYQTEFVPRIGERIVLRYKEAGESLRTHYYRVKDVAYRLDQPLNEQAMVLIEEDDNPILWPE